ncbi:MAG: ParB/RepB/Spo0J family partition protein [Ruminococcaceae bacterium]|nr:ParB/RepB/Spo0J family partition protein [Oscillospiraceae bacterium]
MAKKQGLGRGLDAIFLDNSVPEDNSSSQDKLTVPISHIDTNPDQPRKSFDAAALAGLADSISANGLLQPILVRKIGDRYEIIAGERRFRASKLAGLNEIPVIVTEADDLAAAKYALIENLQREDLNPYEEAAAYRALMDEYELSQEEVSIQVGKSRSAIANSLRLLDLPAEVIKMLIDGTIAAGHGRALLGLHDKSQIVPLAERCVMRNLSVRDVEAAVKLANKKLAEEMAQAERDEAEADEVKVDYFAELETRFTNFTGRRCKITSTKNSKTFQIEYKDNEDLEELLKKLAGDGILDNF